MHHFVARTIDGQLLFHSWEEACRLWWLLVRHCPAPRALCVMPDHVHMLHRPEAAQGFHVARRAYAQWLSHRRRSGALWRRAPATETIPPGQKRPRTVRYIHLNPCRARLAEDPLSWPLSTHLDAVGLAVPGARKPDRDVIRFHAYVSGDPTVSLRGTDLPVAALHEPGLDELVDAISAACRVPSGAVLARRGATRSLFVASARALTSQTTAAIGDYATITARAVRNAPSTTTPAISRIARLASDSRIRGLHDHTLPDRIRTPRRLR